MSAPRVLRASRWALTAFRAPDARHDRQSLALWFGGCRRPVLAQAPWLAVADEVLADLRLAGVLHEVEPGVFTRVGPTTTP